MISVVGQSTLLLFSQTPAVHSELEHVLQSHRFSLMSLQSVDELDAQARQACQRADGMLVEVSRDDLQNSCLLQRIRQMVGNLPVLAVSDSRDFSLAVAAIRNGASDFLPRPFTDEELVQHVQQLVADRRMTSVRIDPPSAPRPLSLLTRCETRVLEGVLAAKTTKQISCELQIGLQTVAKHKQRILRKLGARNEVALVLQLLGRDASALAVLHN